MGMKHLLLPVLACVTAIAAPSYDQSGALATERMAITSEFAAAQTALRNAKTATETDAVQQKLVDIVDRSHALRDKTIKANDNLIGILSGQMGYPFRGANDPSATIKATYLKLVQINAGLKSAAVTATAPYQPKDINELQKLLDRVKTAIDEQRHAAQNIETRLNELHFYRPAR